MKRALECFEQSVILIMGGRTKGDDFTVLVRSIAQHVKHVVALGEAQEAIIEALGTVVPASRAQSMDDAVRQAYTMAATGDIVLLSPACASFDMYQNYAERGDHFRTVFNELAKLN